MRDGILILLIVGNGMLAALQLIPIVRGRPGAGLAAKCFVLNVAVAWFMIWVLNLEMQR